MMPPAVQRPPSSAVPLHFPLIFIRAEAAEYMGLNAKTSCVELTVGGAYNSNKYDNRPGVRHAGSGRGAK